VLVHAKLAGDFLTHLPAQGFDPRIRMTASKPIRADRVSKRRSICVMGFPATCFFNAFRRAWSAERPPLLNSRSPRKNNIFGDPRYLREAIYMSAKRSKSPCFAAVSAPVGLLTGHSDRSSVLYIREESPARWGARGLLADHCGAAVLRVPFGNLARFVLDGAVYRNPAAAIAAASPKREEGRPMSI